VLVHVVTIHRSATQLTVDWCMNVVDMCLKLTARYRLVTLLTQNYVPLAVNLVDNIVALGNVSLATFTIISVTSQRLNIKKCQKFTNDA